MSAVHASERTPASTSRGQPRRVARLAIRLSVVSAVMFAVPIAAIGIVYAVGEANAIEDNWLAYALGFVSFAGLLGSLVTFVMGVVAVIARDRAKLIWLPLAVFPAAVIVLLLGEVFLQD